MDEVELTPFQHKVGGNSYLSRYDDETVSKPFVAREYLFYSNAPESLLPFLPQFKGIADIQFKCQRPGGLLSFCAFNVRSSLLFDELPQTAALISNGGWLSNSTNGSRFSKARSNPILLQRMSQEIVSSCDLVVTTVPCKTHLLQQYDNEALLQLKDVFESNPKHDNKVMLLQNIIYHHYYPCVMDIKIGTRLYHDDMPEEKKQLSIWRCSVSTSKDLALRMGGLKVYSANDNSYTVMDKYAGRDLNATGFHKAIELFFDTEPNARKIIVRAVIEKLEKLHHAVAASTQTRLYACSILLIYEGDTTCNAIHPRADVKLIDFENASYSCQEYSSPTDGCLLGIRNLIEMLKDL